MAFTTYLLKKDPKIQWLRYIQIHYIARSSANIPDPECPKDSSREYQDSGRRFSGKCTNFGQCCSQKGKGKKKKKKGNC